MLSEYEYRNYIHENTGSVFPSQRAVLLNIMNNSYCRLIDFEKKPVFCGINFQGRLPPWDWIMANPKITVYRKKG